MTIEELLECSPEILEKMSDAELLKHFEPFLNVTRPERIVKKATKTEVKEYISPARQKALDFLADSGIDLSFMKHKRKGK